MTAFALRAISSGWLSQRQVHVFEVTCACRKMFRNGSNTDISQTCTLQPAEWSTRLLNSDAVPKGHQPLSDPWSGMKKMSSKGGPLYLFTDVSKWNEQIAQQTQRG
jgi:hypothetical protein